MFKWFRIMINEHDHFTPLGNTFSFSYNEIIVDTIIYRKDGAIYYMSVCERRSYRQHTLIVVAIYLLYTIINMSAFF